MVTKPKSALAAMALAVAAAMPLGASAQEMTKITVGYGLTSDFLPVYVAQDNGIFAAHGLDVTAIALNSSSLAPPALVGGSMTIAQTTPSNIILANDGGLDLVAVAAVGRLKKVNPHTSLVTRKGFVATVPADFKGKTIAVPGIGAAMDLVLRKWLLDGKVSLDQLTIAEAPFAQMGDRLQSGQLDAAFEFEPMLSRVLASGQAQRSVDVMSAVNPDVLGASYAATRAWASSHRQAVNAYRASLSEAIAWIVKNPAQAHEVEKKWLHYATEGSARHNHRGN